MNERQDEKFAQFVDHSQSSWSTNGDQRFRIPHAVAHSTSPCTTT